MRSDKTREILRVAKRRIGPTDWVKNELQTTPPVSISTRLRRYGPRGGPVHDVLPKVIGNFGPLVVNDQTLLDAPPAESQSCLKAKGLLREGVAPGL